MTEPSFSGQLSAVASPSKAAELVGKLTQLVQKVLVKEALDARHFLADFEVRRGLRGGILVFTSRAGLLGLSSRHLANEGRLI